MLTFADARVFLNPAPVAPRQPVLPVALVGHVPGAARPERLSRALREPWHGLGLQQREQQLDHALANGPAGDDDDALLALHHLPLALDSHAQFLDLFPDAGTAATGPAAPVGAAPWLPLAVEDFFAAGGERLWLVRVPEGEGRDGLLPAHPGDPARPDTLRGLDVALNVPDIGLVALPDLERLQLPAGLDPLPDFTPAPAQARFVPVDELARADAVPTPPPSPLSPPWPLAEVVRRLCARFETWRPDVQALLTLQQAVEASGLLEKHPEIDLAKNKFGIFAKLSKLDTLLRDRDRVEIYRPLIADPKEVRKQRAAEGKVMKKGAGDADAPES